MGFTLQQQKTTTLSSFVLAGCWTWRKNGFLFVVTQHTAVLRSCFSPVWQNPFFYRSWWLDWDHNDTRCSIKEALHFARLSVIFNFISSCGRKQTRPKHWCVNVSSSLVVKTPYRMESQVPHQCLMNIGDFFSQLLRGNVLLVWGITSREQPHPFLQALIPQNVSVSGLKWCLVSLEEQLPYTQIFTLLSPFSSDAGWYKRTPEIDVSFTANPIPTHPLPKTACTGYLLFPPHLTQIHIIPCPSPPPRLLLSFQPSQCIILSNFPQITSHIELKCHSTFILLHSSMTLPLLPFPLSWTLCCHGKVK